MKKVVDFMVEQPNTDRGLKKSTLRSRHEPRVLIQTQSLVWKKLNGIDVHETSSMEPAHSTTLVYGTCAREATMNHPTYYIGIDVAADTFTVAIFTSPGQPTVVGPQFANTLEGLEEFHRWLGQHRAMSENAVLCLEATGVYAETLCYYLCSKVLPRCCRAAPEGQTSFSAVCSQERHCGCSTDRRVCSSVLR